MIPYSRQSVFQEDIDAVVDVLESNFLTQGPVVPEFEKAICEYTRAQFAVAVNSGTSALHIACLSLGLGKDDYLWTVPNTFVASANCGLYCGAQVDFVDIDAQSWNIDVEKLQEKLAIAAKSGKLPKILVVVHYAGLPADMQQIHDLSKEYGFAVIEDACHALGAFYQQEPIGRCVFSDLTVFSFHPLKSITSGEGGMAVTNDAQLAAQMKMLASHGITRDESLMEKSPDGPWYYQQLYLGYNYRMSDIHAALGLSQLKRLDNFVKKRRDVTERYNKELSKLPLQLPLSSNDRSSAHHLYPLRITTSADIQRKQLFIFLRENGIGVNVHYIPVHLQPFYRKMGFREGDFPVAEQFYQSAVSIPCYPTLTEQDQQFVIESLKQFFQ